jgi:hypothetical protein
VCGELLIFPQSFAGRAEQEFDQEAKLAQRISPIADSMADGAVSCEPLSNRQFPVTSGRTAIYSL